MNPKIKPDALQRKRLSRISRDCAEHKLYYIHQTPREVPLGLILVHNFPGPTGAIKLGRMDGGYSLYPTTAAREILATAVELQT
jgi:hypothetical protein